MKELEPFWIFEVVEAEHDAQSYYHDLQFKLVVTIPNGLEIEIADGGFTNWMQQLTSNKKERFLISGIGLELLFKLLNGRIS